MILNWSVSPSDYALIQEIAERAVALYQRHSLKYALQDVVMDLTATHANGCPLDLSGLLAAAPADFSHDIAGIRLHLDRETGQLMDCFTPRYAK